VFISEQYYNCSSTIIASGVVLEGQYVSNECQIRYKGGLIPNITWTGLLPFDQAYIANNEAIWSGMRLNATREMNSRAYTARAYFTGYFLPVDGDTASNIPVTDGYYSSPQMFVYCKFAVVSFCIFRYRTYSAGCFLGFQNWWRRGGGVRNVQYW